MIYKLDEKYYTYEQLKKGYKAIAISGNQLSAYPSSWSDDRIKKEATGKTLYMSLDDFIK